MAYEFKDPRQGDLDEERLRNPNDPIPFGGAVGASMQPGDQRVTAPTSAATSGGTGFVNFERYLNANRDNASRNAAEISSTVGQRAEGARQATNTAVNAQNSRIANSSLGYNGEAVRSTGANGQATQLVAGNGGVQADAYNPTNGYAITATGNVETIAPTTTYVSPEEAQARSTAQMNVGSIAGSQEYANAQRQAEKANTLLDATKSNAGLQGLLQQQVKDAGRSDGYTQGMNRFDAALVGGVGNRRFANTRAKYGNLMQVLGDSVAADDVARQQAAESTATAASQYQALYDRWLRDEEEARKRREAEQQAGGSEDKSQHITMRTTWPEKSSV